MSNIDECEPFQLTSPERTRELDRQLYADHLAEEHAERRERIATAALQGMLACDTIVRWSLEDERGWLREDFARQAVAQADYLIKVLDSKDVP